MDEFATACQHMYGCGQTSTLRILIFIIAGCEDRKINLDTAADLAGITPPTARKHLKYAEELGYIEPDETRTIGWRIKPLASSEE